MNHLFKSMLSAKSSLALLLLIVMLSLAPQSPGKQQPASPSSATETYIIQGTDVAAARQAVTAVAGELTRDLGIIGAVAAELTPAQVDQLTALAPAVRLWADAPVTGAALDAATRFTPTAFVETRPTAFDLNDVKYCDGTRSTLQKAVIGDEAVAHVHQGYSFDTNVHNALPAAATFALTYRPVDLASITLYVYEASTGIWHPFTRDARNDDRQNVTALFDLTTVLHTAADYATVAVKVAAQSVFEDSGRLKVDCAVLQAR